MNEKKLAVRFNEMQARGMIERKMTSKGEQWKVTSNFNRQFDTAFRELSLDPRHKTDAKEETVRLATILAIARCHGTWMDEPAIVDCVNIISTFRATSANPEEQK